MFHYDMRVTQACCLTISEANAYSFKAYTATNTRVSPENMTYAKLHCFF